MAEDVFGTISVMVNYVGWTCEILSHHHFACLSSPFYSVLSSCKWIIGRWQWSWWFWAQKRDRNAFDAFIVFYTHEVTTSTFGVSVCSETREPARFRVFIWMFAWKQRTKSKFMFNIEFMSFIFDDRFGAELTLCREWRCAKIVILYLYSERSKVAVGRSMNVWVHVNCSVRTWAGSRIKKPSFFARDVFSFFKMDRITIYTEFKMWSFHAIWFN